MDTRQTWSRGGLVPASHDDAELFYADLMGARPRARALIPPPPSRVRAPRPAGTVVEALQALRLRMDWIEARARELDPQRAESLLGREQRRLERALDGLLESEPVDEPGVLEQLVSLAAPRHPIAIPRARVWGEDEDTYGEVLPAAQLVSLAIPTTASSASTFWGSVVATNARESRAGKLAVYVDGDLRYVAMAPSTMRVIRRTATELFGTTVSREVAANNLRVVINANMFDLSTSGKIDVAWGHDPVPAGATSPIGRVVTGGRVVGGSSEPDRFHVAYNAVWAAPLPPLHSHPMYRFGQGDPPGGTSGAEEAVGGMGPIIIGGLRYGVGNLYRSGVPAGAPVTGAVPPAYLPYLVQRNNNHYLSLQGRGAAVGKVVVAINRAQDLLLMLVQSQGGSSGMTLDTLRDKLIAVGCEDAVFGDGSDSVMLVVGGTTLIAQGSDKEEATTVGIGFV